MSVTSEKFQSLLQANQILSSTLNLSELLHQVMRLATDVVEAETSSILLYDEAHDELVFNLALGDKESELKEIRLQLDEGIAGWVARERKCKIVNDIEKDPNWAKRTDDKIDFVTKSVLAVPLVYKDRLLGVVEAVNKKKGEFTPEDEEVMEAFAAQTAVAMENARLFTNLQEEKEKIEAIFSQMSDGAIFVDPGCKKILANKQAENCLGEEWISKADLNEIFSEFEISPSISDALNRKEEFIPIEFKRKEGKPLYLSGVISRILDAHGKLLGLIVIFRDTTLEKKEGMLKRNFLSLISHKLKTPLVTITGYGPLLLNDPKLDDFQKKAIKSIHSQGVHLSNLVDKLLYFTMAEGEKLTLKKDTINLSSLVDKAQLSLKSYMADKGAKISICEDIKKLPDVHIDKSRIESVIINIIENAVKFNTKEQKEVEISSFEKDGFIGISIKDNGTGIPPEEREKIFHKFYQIEESFTGQVEGAGLGLALVKQVIEAHGGKIDVDSSVGEGSTFSFLLPKE